MLNKMWDMDLEEREAEFKDDLREASGVGKMKKKVRSVLPSLYPYPSQCICTRVRSAAGDGAQCSRSKCAP